MSSQEPPEGPRRVDDSPAAMARLWGPGDPLLSFEELECMISLIEMTLDEASCTFGDWLETNSDAEVLLARLEAKLRLIESAMAKTKRSPKRRRYTLRLREPR